MTVVGLNCENSCEFKPNYCQISERTTPNHSTVRLPDDGCSYNVNERTMGETEPLKNSSSRNPSIVRIVGSQGMTRQSPGPQGNGFVPPDGGWGWVVCMASFWVNGTIFGIINSYGIIYVKLKEKFEDSYEDASFLTSLIGSVCIGMTFLLSPLASILTDRYGIQRTAFAGGILATAGMFLSSLVLTHLEPLYLTYGVLLGAGASLAYTPSLVVLGHYFKRKMGLVNGIVTAGSSIFTMIMPLLLTWLLKNAGISGTLQVLSFLMATTMLCALTFRPLIPQHPNPEPDASLEQSKATRVLHKIINVSIWKNKRYVLWIIAIPSALFGYFVPYVHLVQHVKDTLPHANGEILVTCIGLTSGIGRIVFGKIADYPKVNRIALQQTSFVSIGILTMLLVFANRFEYLVAMCLFMGLFDGCFISLLGPIAFDIVGHSGASQAIGFLLGLCSIPLTVGPPLAGLIYDRKKNYQLAFLLAGVPPLVGASLMCMMQCSPNREPESHCEAPRLEGEAEEQLNLVQNKTQDTHHEDISSLGKKHSANQIQAPTFRSPNSNEGTLLSKSDRRLNNISDL